MKKIITEILSAVLVLNIGLALMRAAEQINISASSEMQPAANAMDGNMSTRWESEHGVDPSWIIFKFAEQKSIKNLTIYWEFASAKDYAVQISEDGDSWKTVKKITEGKSEESAFFTFAQELKTKYLRILCNTRTTEWGYSIWEVEINAALIDGMQTGRVISDVKCLHDATQSYALYLPKNYNKEKKNWPIIYGYSPDGRGTDAVNLLKGVAEELGFIVVGSNNARNGPWDPILKAIDAVVRDTEKKFQLHYNRRYAGGFSGGARMSFAMARKYPYKISGIIPCSAGFDEDSYIRPQNMAVYALTGISDFNKNEVENMARRLGWGGNSMIELKVFNGGHQWPPAEEMATAVRWLSGKYTGNK